MPAQSTRTARRLLLTPQEPLVAGGPAEEFERRIQDIFKSGFEHLVIDMRGVPALDSAGVRALVRGHTTAQRLHRRFTLVSPNKNVRDVLELSLLARILEVVDTLVEAQERTIPWNHILTALGVVVAGAAMVAAGIWWPNFGNTDYAAVPSAFGGGGADPNSTPAMMHPMFELGKLVAAAVIGMLVTIVHRQYRTERLPNPMMDQAQVLLCIAGAMIMIIIGNSVARAFGIAGAASIIRFRTPIEDARDIIVLFILMGLGMAAGLGALGVAGLGTVFLCAMIPILNQFSSERPRTMLVEIQAEDREFPTAHVVQVFALNGVIFEPREVSQGDEATVRYQTTLRPTDSLEDLSSQLIGDGKKGIKNVSWSAPKRG